MKHKIFPLSVALIYIFISAYLMWFSRTCITPYCGAALLEAFKPWLLIPQVDKNMAVLGGWLISKLPVIYVQIIFIGIFAVVWYVIGLISYKILSFLSVVKKTAELRENFPVIFGVLAAYTVLVPIFYYLSYFTLTQDGKAEDLIVSVLLMPCLLIIHLIDIFKPNTGYYFADNLTGALYFACATVNLFIYYLVLNNLMMTVKKLAEKRS